MIAKLSRMVNSMEVGDFFMRKLNESAIILDNIMSLLSKHLKGYVPDGRHTGIASSKHPVGVDQLTEVKVIHSGAV